LCCATLIGVAVAQTQRERELMLPSPVTMTGIIMDNERRPLSEVWIAHTGVPLNIKTDAQGRFEVKTSAPAVVFRKAGFQSKYWRVREDRNLSVTLTGPAPLMKECRAADKCVSLKGFLVTTFCLAKAHGVEVSKQGNDVDYGQRWFGIRTHNGNAGIQLAGGLLWGSGWPRDEDVWSTGDYNETSYRDRDGFLIVDARGTNGGKWRSLGHAFETASYRNVDSQDTPLLDRVLDGACVLPRRN
jgi:hypothetical protein